MNKEIKEILYLEKYIDKYKSDEKSIINGNRLTTPAMLDYLEVKALLDYITNLQEENEKLKEYQESYRKELDFWRIQFSNKEDRIDKALEYITKNTEYLDIEKGEVFECEGYKSNRVPIISVSGLLDILRGENNE